MRQAFIVTYDVCDPKRLRRVFRICRGYGEHLQLSVFYCELSDQEMIELRARLSQVVHHDRDQVLFIDVGPAEGRAQQAIRALGRAYVPPERRAVIL